jgi:hypothetical protein
MARLLMGRRARSSSRGQILPLFVIFLTAMLLMMSLVLDASSALLMKRGYQSAADAAAMAAANVSGFDSKGCAASLGAATTAAGNSVAANLPGYAGPITVSCVTTGPYAGIAVQVSLSGASPGFFSRVVGINSFAVNTTATAINGQITGAQWSVVELDPYNPSWSNGLRGCPSVLFQGSMTTVFDGSFHVDSACPASGGGALSTNGNGGSVTFNNGSGAYLFGEYSPGSMTITPTPLSHQGLILDPLRTLPSPTGLALATQQTSGLVLNNEDRILNPGIYVGGIQLKNSSRAFLKPGIYYIQGGGLAVGSQAAVYSVTNTFTLPTPSSSWTDANWATTDCPIDQCGVLIVNAGTTSTMSNVSLTAGAAFKARPYKPAVPGNNVIVPAYKGILIWQLASPVDTSSYQQPQLQFHGGGTVDISGTVYAPSAAVYMTGGSGGHAGDATNLTIQFISWDLTIQGNAGFHFYYLSDQFAKPFGYGLVQ